MPSPSSFTNRDDFFEVCIPRVLDEGTADSSSQAVAICSSMWRNRGKSSDNEDDENRKSVSRVIETKDIDGPQGQKLGEVRGYIATWTRDTGIGSRFGKPERILKGAYAKSLAQFRRDDRDVRMKDHHGRVIGVFPIESVREDDFGLFAIGHINLEVQQGREAYALVKQGAITEFSVGHVVRRSRMTVTERIILEAQLIEGSLVSEAMNPAARITEFKKRGHIMEFDFSLAPEGHVWNAADAEARIQEFYDVKDGEVSSEFKSMFATVNGDQLENHTNLLFDVVGGEIVVVPSAVRECKGVTGTGMEILRNCYTLMGEEAPGDSPQPRKYMLEEVKSWTSRELETALTKGAQFSRRAARHVVHLAASTEEKSTSETLAEDMVADLLKTLRPKTE